MRTRFILFLLVLSGIFHFSGKSYFPSFENPGKDRYGGIFRMNLGEDFRSLYPLNIVEMNSLHIAGQVYEGLVKFDPKTLQVYPCLARSWSVNSDGKVYTFNLRTNVYFHDDLCFPDAKGRKLIAADVRYCLLKAIQPSAVNMNQFTFKDAFTKEGVRVINDSTLEIQLLQPVPEFTMQLCMQAGWIYPPEAMEKYEDDMRVHCVGTGPFIVRQVREGEVVTLERNPGYWNEDEFGNRLPYLDGIKFTFVKDPGQALLNFKAGEFDLFGNLNVTTTDSIIRGYISSFSVMRPPFVLLADTSLSTTFYAFNTTVPPFDNPDVRRAICMAIDRDYASHLDPGSIPAHNGIVPPGMTNYPAHQLGLAYNPREAKKLLAKAGYPGGKGFPEITLQVNIRWDGGNQLVAEGLIQQLWENLEISVRLEVLMFAQHLQ